MSDLKRCRNVHLEMASSLVQQRVMSLADINFLKYMTIFTLVDSFTKFVDSFSSK